MRLELTGRHVEITPDVRRLVVTKLAKLERLLNDSAVSAQAVLTRERHQLKVDITLHARGERFLHGVGSSTTWEASIAEAMDRLGQQAQKLKGKWQERKRHGAAKGAAASEPESDGIAPQAVNVKAAGARVGRGRRRMPRILRATRQTVRSMSVADAAGQLAGDGDGIVIFLDAETASISVVYRRSDGEVTLVQTET